MKQGPNGHVRRGGAGWRRQVKAGARGLSKRTSFGDRKRENNTTKPRAGEGEMVGGGFKVFGNWQLAIKWAVGAGA